MSDDSSGSDGDTGRDRGNWVLRFVVMRGVMPVVLTIAGVAMCAAAWAMLVNNERSAVRNATTMHQVAPDLIEVRPDVVDRGNDGKFVLVSGMAVVADTLEDEEFGVSVKAARLERKVEMLQWEARFGVLGLELMEKAFSLADREPPEDWLFKKVWSAAPIDSSDFKNWPDKRNPEAKAYRDAEWTARDVRVGAFRVPRVFAHLVGEPDHLELSPTAQYRSPHDIVPAVVDGRLFLGRDPADPQVGELRVTYRAQRPGPVTVVGEQRGDQLFSYAGAARSGPGVADLRNGSLAPWRMLLAMEFAAALEAWKLRALGTLIAIGGGCVLLCSPLLFLTWLPVLGRWRPRDRLMPALATGAVLGAAGAVVTMVWVWVSLRLEAGLPWTPIIGVVLLLGLVWKAASTGWAHRSVLLARSGLT